MSMTPLDELLVHLSPDQRHMLAREQSIRSTALMLAASPGSGMAVALRYLQMELQPLINQSRIGPVTPPARSPLSGPRRGILRPLVIEGMEVEGIQSGNEWRCSTSRLSEMVHPTGNKSWLGGCINRDAGFVRLVLRPEGFTGVREPLTVSRQSASGLLRSPTYNTLSQSDAVLVIKHREAVYV